LNINAVTLNRTYLWLELAVKCCIVGDEKAPLFNIVFSSVELKKQGDIQFEQYGGIYP
jgi:hypothetical protein